MKSLERIKELEQFIVENILKTNKDNKIIINGSRCIKRYFTNNNFLDFYNDFIDIELEKNVKLVPFKEKIEYVLNSNDTLYDSIKEFIINNLIVNDKFVDSRLQKRYFINLDKLDIYNLIDGIKIEKEVTTIKCAILHIINDKYVDEFCECGNPYRYVGRTPSAREDF